MPIQTENVTNVQSANGEKGSLLRRAILIILFLVLLTDMTPSLGIGIAPGLSGKNLLLYIVVIMISVMAVTDFHGVRFSDLDVHAPFLLLICYATATIVIASAFSPTYDMKEGIVALKNQLFDLYLFMFAFRYGLDRRVDFIFILRFIVATLLILSFVTLIDFLGIVNIGMIETHHGRVEGPFGQANQYGALLAFLLPLSIALISPTFGRWKKLFWWSGIVVTGMLLLATGSRGALVSVTLGSVIATILLRRHLDMKRVLKFAAIAIGLLLVFVIMFAIFNADLVLNTLERTTSDDIDIASAGRIEIWTAAILIMLEWPFSFLVGNGWNSFSSSGLWKSAHNEYLDRWFELGLIGLFLSVVLLYTITTRVRRRLVTADPELRGILVGYVFSISAILVSIFFSALPDTWTVIWVVVGLIMGLQATTASNEPLNKPGLDKSAIASRRPAVGALNPGFESRIDAAKQ